MWARESCYQCFVMKSEKKESLNEDVLSKFWTFLENWLQSQKLSHMTKEEDLRDLEIINITSHVAYTDHTHAATTWRPCQLPACLRTDVWGKSQSVNHFRHALWLKQNIKQQAGTNSTTPEKKQHSSIRIQTVFFPPFILPLLNNVQHSSVYSWAAILLSEVWNQTLCSS